MLGRCSFSSASAPSDRTSVRGRTGRVRAVTTPLSGPACGSSSSSRCSSYRLRAGAGGSWNSAGSAVPRWRSEGDRSGSAKMAGRSAMPAETASIRSGDPVSSTLQYAPPEQNLCPSGGAPRRVPHGRLPAARGIDDREPPRIPVGSPRADSSVRNREVGCTRGISIPTTACDSSRRALSPATRRRVPTSAQNASARHTVTEPL